jgi:glutaredoxin 3
MKKIEIYTKSYCTYCQRAKDLLRSKNVRFTEYDVTDDPEGQQEMRRRSGRTTVPEIFIDDRLIGGCDDLMALEANGALDRLLGE